MKIRKIIDYDIRLKYITLNSNDTYNFLPMVSIKLVHKGRITRGLALIDSGSTATFIPPSTAELLGLELKTQNNSISGVGGAFLSFSTSLDMITVLDAQTPLVQFEDLSVYVPSNNSEIPFILLGRDSIFSAFDIKFKEHAQQIELLQIKD